MCLVARLGLELMTLISPPVPVSYPKEVSVPTTSLSSATLAQEDRQEVEISEEPETTTDDEDKVRFTNLPPVQFNSKGEIQSLTF